ncbi:MAG: penicillin acylase family protein [Vicinamibacteria bacterium]|nr:penicillin acylase family protein [Vicinamibacteria bacterium]
MRRLLTAAFLIALTAGAAFAQTIDPAQWAQQASRVTIVRDDRGIPHIYARTDADAVFGMIYAQAEDDFNRVETNYLNSTGRLAEAEGESALYQDLRQRLFIDEAEMRRLYSESPAWLKALMNAWADGLNYYLHTHPNVKPRAIARFEPWMPLSFSEGSIGGDIERVSVPALKAFYEKTPLAKVATIDVGRREEPGGSNGIAIMPSHTAGGKALFLINPHTSFYFRSEANVVSEEGLNVYGASTWGQFFVYQGFNDRLGWMHTSSGVDNIDDYVETISRKGDALTYRHGGADKPVKTRKVTIRYKTDAGMGSRDFTVYRTHHGPIVREAAAGEAGVTSPGEHWVATAMMEEPLKALIQSYTRTKARSFAEFRKIMDLHTNSSNNTIYADGDGVIAYFHANFTPRRDPKFNWRKPVDGADPATDWKGVHSVDESPLVVSPKNGWVYNTNNWPYSAAGADSPRRADFPAYMEEGVENPRGIHAIRVLSKRTDFTLDSLIAAAYDPYLPAFADLVPLLVKAWDEAPAPDPTKAKVAPAVAALRSWDFRWSADSVPTSLAVFWGEDIWRRAAREADDENSTVYDYIATKTTGAQKLASLAAAMDKLTADFGKWNMPWGEINRYQRRTGDIVQPFDDDDPSHPVPFVSSRWGSLASFQARAYPRTRKWYGTSGNSFVAAVEFGPRIRARAVMAGGQSGDVSSKHFKDQIERYAAGNLRDVYFYREQLEGRTEKTYHPGQ